jgi:rhodanese-related sulfurtransferase
MDFVNSAKAQIEEVTPEQLENLLGNTDNMLVLDVRESSEHEQGHIKGAMLVPRGILEAAADKDYPKHQTELVAARSRPVAIYCATGGRSAMAAATLKLMGYENVVSLAGGIVRWQQEDRPMVREARYI